MVHYASDEGPLWTKNRPGYETSPGALNYVYLAYAIVLRFHILPR